MNLTVGELKQALQDIPDNAGVIFGLDTPDEIVGIEWDKDVDFQKGENNLYLLFFETPPD